jgi:hypothetical protein
MSEAMFDTIRKIVCETPGLDPEMKIDAALIGKAQATRLKIDNIGALPRKGILVKTTQRQKRQPVKMNLKQNCEMEVSTDVEIGSLSDLAPVRSNTKLANSGAKTNKFNKLKNFLVTKFIG